MLAQDFQRFYLDQIRTVRDEFVNDLEAMTSEQLSARTGQAERCGYDYAYEVAAINRRFVARLRGEAPEDLGEGFVKAPAEHHDKARAIQNVRESFDAFAAAWEREPPEQMTRTITLPSGDTSTPLEYAQLCLTHSAYHDGQLNLIQSITGDQKIHW